MKARRKMPSAPSRWSTRCLPHFVSDAEPPKNIATDTGPISADDFEDMEDNQVPDEEVIAMIEKRGISFKPTDKDLASYKGMGAAPSIIAALRKAKYCRGVRQAKVSLQADGAADAGRARQSIRLGRSGIRRRLWLAVHRALPAWRRTVLPASGRRKKRWWFTSPRKMSLALPPRWPSRLSIPAGNINVLQQNIGGGFGSKFSADRWDINTAKLSKKAGGKPVKNMLDRKAEFEVAGMRPSAYARVKIAADKSGKIVAWDSRSWGTGGVGGGGTPPLPYIFEIPNQRKQNTAISTNQGSARAWRAPNHPQAAVITMGAMEDLAAKLNMDPMDLMLANMEIAGPRAQTYDEEFAIADELMGWKKNWHQRGDKTSGQHQARAWGSPCTPGEAAAITATATSRINPDGSVEIKMGTQDLGTGARTIIVIVAADTLGIPMENVKLLYRQQPLSAVRRQRRQHDVGRGDCRPRAARPWMRAMHCSPKSRPHLRPSPKNWRLLTAGCE